MNSMQKKYCSLCGASLLVGIFMVAEVGISFCHECEHSSKPHVPEENQGLIYPEVIVSGYDSSVFTRIG
jgi:hypothetical protein